MDFSNSDTQTQRRPGLFLVYLSGLWAFPALAGAGGTSGDDTSFWLLLLLLPLILGYGAYRTVMKWYAKRAANRVLKASAQRDALWETEHLKQHARDTFVQIQERWSHNDIEGALPHLHPDYTTEFGALIQNNISAGEINRIWNISLGGVDIVLAQDYPDHDRDTFVALVKGTMHDAVFDAVSGEQLRTQGDEKNKPLRQIEEFWRFQRQGDQWLLRGISQSDEAIDEEVSIDAETMAGRYGTGEALERAVDAAEASERRTQTGYQVVAAAIGLSIAIAGYGVYFLAFREVFRLFTD